MPQLVHLRLRVETMCLPLFHTEFDDKDGQDFQPEQLSEDGFVPMPPIGSLLIDCVRAYVNNYDCCRVGRFSSPRRDPRRCSWATLTKTIERIVDISQRENRDGLDSQRDTSYRLSAWVRDPEDVKLLVIGHTDHDDHDDTRWAAVIRADILRK